MTPDDTSTPPTEAPIPVDEPVDEPAEEPAELLTLRDGLPAVLETVAALEEYCAALAAGTGPVAIDAERASGYRYSNRAYLIQLRREGSGTALIDPTAFDSLKPLQEALDGTEWILHAATQDIPCLAELDLHPTALFDTELAGRLLGYPRVGLGTLVETVLGFRMKKEHSAADWSTRPLPQPWLVYAALDVEVLVELRDALASELEEQGKAEWAHQEFKHLEGFTPTPRVEPWRRLSGLHRVRGRRALGAARDLWETRDAIAQQRDVTPGRIVPDSALVAAAAALPTSRESLFATKGFHGRGAERYASRWVDALSRAADLDEDALPARSPRTDGPPPPRSWADKSPVAAVRLGLARDAVAAASEEHRVPVENLCTPDTLRRVLWSPPTTRVAGDLLEAVVDQLADHGVRGWQIAVIAPIVSAAVLEADAVVEREAAEAAARETQPDAAIDDQRGESEDDGAFDASGESVASVGGT